MYNKTIKTMFGIKYYDIVCNYIKLIQNVLNEYDTVVFMARKAYCFYKAILNEGMLKQRTECTIISSRAVTYNNVNLHKKNIAIIEDVVIKGEALADILNLEQLENCNIDVFFLACSSNFINNFIEDEKITISKNYKILEEKELLELATLITNYIVYLEVPYNVDFPILQINLNNRYEIDEILNSQDYFTISSLTNRINPNIKDIVIHINNDIFKGLIRDEILIKTILKIRLYIDYSKNIIQAIPITLLPAITVCELKNMYYELVGDEYDNYIYSKDEKILAENMYKILTYLISNFVFSGFIGKINLNRRQYMRKSIESEVFFEGFLKDSNNVYNGNINVKRTTFYDNNIIKISELLGYSYDVLFDNCTFKDEKTFFNEYITIDDIKKCIFRVEERGEIIDTLASLFLDVFIDNGIIVPRIRFIDGKIIRVYKFGEVGTLTIREIKQFVNALHTFSDLENEDLDKILCEKILVLFFTAFNLKFTVDAEEGETYRVCFTKFGPRLSTTKKRYIVNQHESLFNVLVKEEFIKEVNGKIRPLYCSTNSSITDRESKIYMLGLHKVKQYFILAKDNLELKNDIVFKYIPTFNRLITLLAIGGEEKNKILSLIAEINLIANLKINNKMKIKDKVMELSKVIDGVLSGVWKYSCYKNDDLLNEIERKMNYATSDESSIFVSDKYFNNVSNSKILNVKYLDKLGKLLFDVAIFHKYVCCFYGLALHDDYKNTVYQYSLDNGIYSLAIHEKYRAIFNSKDAFYIEKYIDKSLTDFLLKSYSLIDEFELYDMNSTFNHCSFQKCLVILSSDNKFEQKFHGIPHFIFNDTLVIPVTEENEVTMLENILDFIENDAVRVLYFYSKNENIKLFYNNYFFGKIFKMQLKSVLNNYKLYQFPCIVPELIFVSDEEIVTPQLLRYDFNHVESFKKGNNIFRIYHIKKGEKEMYINEQKVENGIIVNAETIYLNFNNDIYQNRESILKELKEIKKKCNNKDIEKNISDAIENLEKDNNKFMKALKWLGENAFDFIKSVSSGVLVELINKYV